MALISLAGMSWFTVTGPNVITATSQDGDLPTVGPLVFVSPHVGSHHSWLVWTLFVVCVLAAAGAGLRRSGRSVVAGIVADILAALLILHAGVRVVVPRLIIDAAALPPDTKVNVQVGFWFVLVGFALIGLGAAVSLTISAHSDPRPSDHVGGAGWATQSPASP
ncbi:MAG: hypothetical protein ACR2KJ_10965 [Jatrophihabitans sp.]